MSKLHVFYCSEVEEWWVAESPEHATQLSEKATRMTRGEVGIPLPEEWEQIPDGSSIKINEADEPGGPAVAKTAGEWAVENGPGLLCSVEC
jgi:hypothetical protein